MCASNLLRNILLLNVEKTYSDTRYQSLKVIIIIFLPLSYSEKITFLKILFLDSLCNTRDISKHVQKLTEKETKCYYLRTPAIVRTKFKCLYMD